MTMTMSDYDYAYGTTYGYAICILFIMENGLHSHKYIGNRVGEGGKGTRLVMQ